jgi:competence protein ComEC
MCIRDRLLTILIQLGGVFSIYLQYPTYPLSVTFFDIGQGDSVLIEFDNKEILVDTGPDNRIVEKLSSKFKANPDTINYIILTHPDMDHIGGMCDILESYDIENIILNFDLEEVNSKYFERLKLAIEKENSKLISVDDMSDFSLDDLNIDILWPEASSSKLSDNDSSITIKFSYKGFDFFLGGDISSDIEEKIISKVGQVELLKLSHHGSNTSNSLAFLKELNPKYAVASVGRDNKYNHPSENVLGILASNSIQYFRTDEEGDIVCKAKDDKDFICNASFFLKMLLCYNDKNFTYYI